MNVKHRITLTAKERAELESLISQGRIQGYHIRHAQMMLALDEISHFHFGYPPLYLNSH